MVRASPSAALIDIARESKTTGRYWSVMESAHFRSKGVNETLAMPLPVAIDGHQDAFEELYRSSRDDVYAYVATLLGDRGAAEDVTALAFERAYRRRRTFRADRGSRRAWLFGIAR